MAGVEPPWESLGTSREISEDPVGDESTALVHSWLEECIHDHPQCPSATTSPPPLPKRVLELAPPDKSQDSPLRIKLRETNDEYGVYATLSHCWGSDEDSKKNFKTKWESIKTRFEGIDWIQLPRTYQDAIFIAHKLHIPYIWIDSLCIIQDDREDWEIESAKMGSVYSNAFLTIAASSAPNSQAGFLGTRSQYHPKDLQFFPNCSPKSPHAIKVRELAPRSIEPQDPLAGRAWAYQERLLSPRFLSFNSDQIRWYCRSRIYYESFQTNVATGTTDTEYEDPFRWWRNEIVKEYSQRRLTFERDVLPAISGIAMQIQTKTNDTYLAGLWKTDLRRGLMWSTWPQRPASPCKAFRAPTWSWASIKNSVTFAGDEYVPLIRVINAECTLAGANPCGQVSDGLIVLYGLVMQTRMTISALGPDGNEAPLKYNLDLRRDEHDVEMVYFPDVPLSEGTVGSEITVQRSRLEPSKPRPAVDAQVWCLFLARRYPKYRGGTVDWILMLLGRSNTVTGAFERLGLVEAQVHGEDLADGMAPTEVIIV
jgi:hypothetical protein